LDFNRLKAIWDQHYDNIIYIPTEAAQPVLGWAAVEEYYRKVASLIDRITTMRVGDVSLDVFRDVAYAFCTFHAEVNFKAQNQPMIVDARNTFILRRKTGTWKIIHYHESRPYLPPGA
jgi:ketosteroid isomerase-like protein